MPLTKLQSHVLRVLAAERSPDSYIAGGIAPNREGPRFSADIDIFQDSEQRIEAAAESDAQALSKAGLTLSWKKMAPGKREAEVEGLGDRMRLEWVPDSAFRFFPAQRDELFGYVLHPADLATNKASTAADDANPATLSNLVTIHENILPLGAVISAAVGRFPGQSREEMLSEIVRHSRFTAEEFRVLATERPIDVPDLHRHIRTMIEDARRFISLIPSDAVGVVFLDEGKPVQPDLVAIGKGALGKYSAARERRAAYGRRPRRYGARCSSATTRKPTATSRSGNVADWVLFATTVVIEPGCTASAFRTLRSE